MSYQSTEPTLFDSQLSRILVRLGVVAAGIGAIVFVSLRIDDFVTDGVSMLLLALATVASALLAVRHGTFERGIFLVVVCAGVVNFVSLPTGRESRVVISLALALLLIFFWLFQLLFSGGRSEQRLIASPVNKPVLIFIGINIVAYVWSLLTRDPLLQIWPSFPVVQVAALLLIIAMPLLTLLAANRVRDDKWVRRYVWFMVALGILNAVVKIGWLPQAIQTYIGNGTSGLFATWVGAVAFGALMFDKKLTTSQRVLLVVVLLLQLYYYFFRYRLWLSGWLPMGVAIAVITFFRSKRLFAAMMFVVVIAAVWNADSLYRSIVADNVDEGGLQRIDIWRMNLNHVVNHPILGMGPAGYAIYNMTYHPQDARSTHNNYFDILAQSGVLGFAAFVYLAVTLLRTGNRARLRYQGRDDFREAFVNTAFGGMVASLVAMALGDWVLPFAYNITIMGFDHAMHAWLAPGLMLSLLNAIERNEPAAAGAVALPDPHKHIVAPQR